MEMSFDTERGMDVLLRMLPTKHWVPVGVLFPLSKAIGPNPVQGHADYSRQMRLQPAHQERDPVRPDVIRGRKLQASPYATRGGTNHNIHETLATIDDNPG